MEYYIFLRKMPYFYDMDGYDSLNYVISGFYEYYDSDNQEFDWYSFIKTTTDAGRSWKTIWKAYVSLGGEDYELKRVDRLKMFSPKEIIAGVHPHFFLKTTDAGETWDTIEVNSGEKCVSMSFYDDKLGAAFFKFSDDGIVITEDGGYNWNVINYPYLENYDKFYIDDIDWLSDSTLLLHHYNIPDAFKWIFKSTDRGKNWETIEVNDNYTYSHLYIDEKTGYMSGNKVFNEDFTPVIMKTTDGGYNWNYVYVGESTYGGTLHRLCQSSGNKITGVNNGLILSTTDGGETWYEESYEELSPSNMLRVICYGGGGKSGLLSTMANDIYSNSYTDAVKDEQSCTNDEVSVYPNPAYTKEINIKLNTDNMTSLKIELISNLGKLLKSTVYKNSGNDGNIFRFIADDSLIPGIYFIRITKNELVQYTKAIVIM